MSIIATTENTTPHLRHVTLIQTLPEFGLTDRISTQESEIWLGLVLDGSDVAIFDIY